MRTRWMRLLLAIGSLLVAAAPGSATNFLFDQITDTNDVSVFGRSVVVDSAGIGHVVWSQGYEQIYHGWFDENGWIGEENLSEEGYGNLYSPMICIDPSGSTIHMVWIGTPTGGYEDTYYQRWDGTGWSEPVGLQLGDGTLDIAADTDGNVLVVCSFAGGPHLHGVIYTRWDGLAWTVPEPLPEDPYGHEHLPVVAADAQGNFHAFWTTPGPIFYRRWDGESWTSDEIFWSEADFGVPGSAVSGPDGTVRVVWSAGDWASENLYSSLWNGSAWSAPEQLTSVAQVQDRAAIAASRGGDWRVAFVDSRTGTRQLYWIAWVDGAWQEEEQLTNTSAWSEVPSISSDPVGEWHIVWAEHTIGSDLFYGRSIPPTSPSISDCLPRFGYRDEQTGLLIRGADFFQGDEVWLSRLGQPQIPAEVVASTGEEHVCRFDLDGAAIGIWDLHVQNWDGAQGSLLGAFEVHPAVPWSETERLTFDPMPSLAPSVTTDPEDRLHLVWTDDRDDADEIYYRMYDGLGWTDDERLTFDPAVSEEPQITCTPEGTLYLVWRDRRDGNGEIYAKRNEAGAWTPDERLTDEPAASSHPSIVADADGNLHLAWTDERDGDAEIYYRKWDGAAWSAEERVTTNPSTSDWADLVVDEGGTVHLVWTDDRDGNNEIYYARRDVGTWSSEERLTNAVSHSWYPAITLDPTGNPWVLWRDHRYGLLGIYTKRFDGEGWSLDEMLASSSYIEEPISVSSSTSGTIHLVYQSSVDGNPEIHHLRWDGLVWTTAERLTWEAGASIAPVVSTTDAGRVDVVWVEWLDSYWEIFWKTRDPFSTPAGAPDEPVQTSGLSIRCVPNPFQDRVAFLLPEGSSQTGTLAIFDIRGRLIRRLTSGRPGGPARPINWDGRDDEGREISSGTYFYRFTGGDRSKSGRVLRLR